MIERREGWYWVRDEENTGGTWIPWEWVGESEVICARWADCFTFQEVGPRIPSPDEPWQCVPKEPTREMLQSTGDKSAEAYSGMLGGWMLMLRNAPKPEDV